MTARETRIADIRYFASQGLPFTGEHGPGNLRPLYAFSKSVHAIGARIARKLREFGFTIPGYDHVYIVFTPALGAKVVRPAHVVLEPWQRHFSIGADCEYIEALDDTGREAFVVDATLRVLRRIAGIDASKRALLRRMGREITRDGDNLEILHRAIASKTLLVRISYRIHAGGGGAGWVHVEDLASGRRGSRQFVDLDSCEDLYALVDRVTLAKGVLTLNPRKSASARLAVSRYRTPMRIDIEAVLSNSRITRYSARAPKQ